MRNLMTRVRRLERTLTCPDDQSVVLVRWAIPDPEIQVATVGGAEIKRAHGEPLDAFEGRVEAAARSAGENITWLG